MLSNMWWTDWPLSSPSRTVPTRVAISSSVRSTPSLDSRDLRLARASADSAEYLKRCSEQVAYLPHALHTKGAFSTVLQVRGR